MNEGKIPNNVRWFQLRKRNFHFKKISWMMTRYINEKFCGVKTFSFGGKYRLYENFDKPQRKITPSHNLNNIESQSYSPIYVYKKRELFQFYVVFFTRKELKEVNDGYKYLFSTIDVFSEIAQVYPMKEKNVQM